MPLGAMAGAAWGGFKYGAAGLGRVARTGAAGRAFGGGYAAGAFMRTPTGVGMAAGAGWGMLSDDTSVLGGAMMGGALGRYGARPLMGAARRAGGWGGLLGAARGDFMGAARGVGRTMRAQGRMDWRGGRVLANRGYNKIRGIFI
jgi:hypothetical protein